MTNHENRGRIELRPLGGMSPPPGLSAEWRSVARLVRNGGFDTEVLVYNLRTGLYAAMSGTGAMRTVPQSKIRAALASAGMGAKVDLNATLVFNGMEVRDTAGRLVARATRRSQDRTRTVYLEGLTGRDAVLTLQMTSPDEEREVVQAVHDRLTALAHGAQTRTRRVVIVPFNTTTGNLVEGDWTVIGVAASQDEAEALAHANGHEVADRSYPRDQVPGEALGDDEDTSDAFSVPVLV